ncbi:hypothetical protein FPSE_06693 [Fusarium pseudograminearum CS3096]|uniref:EKC/KEOPS complex subunit BUD32 n=1 Tax=Fusarium pseudograminearum (strain CS3096) TaxID=1028729 RepID=K3VZV9_FUSPC|nr:hypothetical protein FPSE_06693 [Fusarium pseudograminearum CS3096]EKJ73080.1 hypothetical protein FPSE_06693 [Fusarium pseudograminearum CS3096]
MQVLTISLLSALLILPAIRLLPSATGHGPLRNDLLSLASTVASADFDFNRVIPLLRSALVEEPNDVTIWDELYSAVTESTPPSSEIASSIQQLRNTSSFANSSEHRKYVDDVLKEELGAIDVGLPNFHNTYFGSVADLETTSQAFFSHCLVGSEPFFKDGWRGWPKDAKQDDVLSWFADFNDKLMSFAADRKSNPINRYRRPLAKPNELIGGSVGIRKMDIGFMRDPQAGKDSRCHWSQILVPGELKSNPSADKALEAWLDLGRYAREVLAAQDTRRFVLGFTLCGSLMRVWLFDRLGGIASEQFNINEDGLRFVFTILGFLWMDDEELGFDPTIVQKDGEKFIEISQNGSSKRIIIDEVVQRAPCIAGRATTCWKAHPENEPNVLLVIKDSWQYLERDEEGDLLREATQKGVINVARYYHHEVVQVRGLDDDVQSSIRRGLDTRPAAATGTISNRVHRRVILRDYGTPIYRASSRLALLAAFDHCIEGHESLHKAGFLHRDISVNNLMINEDENNPSWPSFLIDLDLAIREPRDAVSGAKGKTGTRAFMSIGVLLDEQHSFMHDLESFFWVLFWICIHYDGPDKSRSVQSFDNWNFIDTQELAWSKKGTVSNERDFLRIMNNNFTPYYQPLMPWINRLRRVVFPNGNRWHRQDSELYTWMREVLQEAQRSLEA